MQPWSPKSDTDVITAWKQMLWQPSAQKSKHLKSLPKCWALLLSDEEVHSAILLNLGQTITQLSSMAVPLLVRGQHSLLFFLSCTKALERASG